MRRTSTLPAKVFKFSPQPMTAARCVGCGSSVNPGMCYTGSVIAGLQFKTIHTTETLPITGVIHTYEGHSTTGLPTGAIIMGGDTIMVDRKVGFFKRNKGFLCDRCSANYHTLTDKSGRKHQLVIVDARPGFIGELAIPLTDSAASKVF